MKDNLRIWIIIAAAAVVILVTGGWLLGAQPLLADAATAGSATTSLVAQNEGLQVKLASLARAAAKTDDLVAKAAVLDKAVPATLKPNTFIRRVNTVAAQDGVTVKTITPGTPVAYTPPASIAAAAAATQAAAAAAATPSATPTPVPTAATAPVATVPVPQFAATSPLITGGNFTVVPMTVTVTGTATAVLQFTKDIQGDERTFLVSGLSTAADSEHSDSVTGMLTGFIYTLAQ